MISPQTGFVIRRASADDYAGIADVLCDARPDRPVTADGVAALDAMRHAPCRARRWIAYASGIAVGVGEYTQNPETYSPHRFWLEVVVRPAWRGRGIGGALYNRVFRGLQSLNAVSVRSTVAASAADALGFLRRRCFEQDSRYIELSLDLTHAQGVTSGMHPADVAAGDVQITSLADLPECDVRDRALHALCAEMTREIPSPEPRAELAFEEFAARTLYNPAVDPRGFFVAVDTCADEPRFVGYSHLFGNAESGVSLYAAMTGVRREYRGRGIARALKLRCIAFAQSIGAAEIRTVNADSNAAILALNRDLGFEPRETWISMVRDVGRSEPGEPASPAIREDSEHCR